MSHAGKLGEMNDVSKQLNHMIAFIDQEVKEKVDEINAKAEEEYNIEKGTYIQNQRLKIIEIYNKKEKQLLALKRVQRSGMMNQARLQILNRREEFINDIFDEVSNKLSDRIKDKTMYKTVLKNFAIQAALILLEPKIFLRVRKEDESLIKPLLKDIKADYKDKTNCDIDIAVDTNYLPQSGLGGLEAYSGRRERIKVTNTFEYKLTMLKEKTLPYVRLILFGMNKNRKYYY